VALWAFAFTKPRAQRSVRKGPRCGRQGTRVRRVEVTREEIKQLRIVGQQCRGPGEQRDRVAPCDICQQRQDFVANPIAAETCLRV
jgi:hypothetical protein